MNLFKATVACGLAVTVLCNDGFSQRRFDQDRSLNNLQHAADYEPGKPGELGAVKKVGSGSKSMILIAGSGFGGSVFDQLVKSWADDYTIYTVTMPGFDGTPAPPMPPNGTSYGELTWTKGVQQGIESLIEEEKLDRPIIVGHWMVAANVALQVALDNPEKVGAAILVSGRAKNVPVGGDSGPQFGSPENRAKWVDQGMAPRWFKTVTRDTWDDNNYYPHDYSSNPIRGLQLWRTAANATLATHVRYLCESLAQDSTIGLEKLKVPTLVIQPGFDDQLYVDSGRDYMRAFCHDSWKDVEELSSHIQVVRIDDSRVFIMDDQLEKLNATMRKFLNEMTKPDQ